MSSSKTSRIVLRFVLDLIFVPGVNSDEESRLVIPDELLTEYMSDVEQVPVAEKKPWSTRRVLGFRYNCGLFNFIPLSKYHLIYCNSFKYFSIDLSLCFSSADRKFAAIRSASGRASNNYF